MNRSFALAWDAIAEAAPGRPALLVNGHRVTWGAFSERSARLAWHLQAEADLEPGNRVGIALTNRSEYLETFFAALKLGCVPVNVDVRYRANDMHDVLDHADAKFVVHEPGLTKVVRTAARRIPKPWRPRLLAVGAPYEAAVAGAAPPQEWEPRRAQGDDVVLFYTGGTTGTTTAVMWRNADLYAALWESSHDGEPDPPDARAPVVADLSDVTVLPSAPLTHTLGLFPALSSLMVGGAVALVGGDFDPVAVWEAVARERVDVLAVGSEGLARRLLVALDGAPGRWDFTGLQAISSGERLSPATRADLVARFPVVAVPSPAPAASRVGERLRVVDAAGHDVEPGSGAVGQIVVGGPVPLGFFKDAARTAAQFRTIDGVHYSIAGGDATVDFDGTVHRGGVGSADIVTGGHAVSAPAVETELRKHASVIDCVVVGVPDVQAGQRVVALVQVVAGHYLDEAELVAWCRTRMVAADTPRHVLFVDALGRGDDGAASRTQLRQTAIDRLAPGSG